MSVDGSRVGLFSNMEDQIYVLLFYVKPVDFRKEMVSVVGK